MAGENPLWGKLGLVVSARSIRPYRRPQIVVAARAGFAIAKSNTTASRADASE
jgi:hypothetical protein